MMGCDGLHSSEMEVRGNSVPKGFFSGILSVLPKKHRLQSGFFYTKEKVSEMVHNMQKLLQEVVEN